MQMESHEMDPGQYATRSVLILHPSTPTEDEYLSWGVTETLPPEEEEEAGAGAADAAAAAKRRLEKRILFGMCCVLEMTGWTGPRE
jgi:hypothetical protein